MIQEAPGPERRQFLRRLDDILEALEQLNLQERPQLPEAVRRSVLAQGIVCEDEPDIRALIERVWRKQEPYLLHLGTERRGVASRRGGTRRPPRHQVVEGILRQLAEPPRPAHS
ncbi:MAG TPA: hypothetical protein VNN74_07475 [Candidatus Micrarchaeia archaeon]|nr:hypothetical protein [Candidatus Micrarchaeia archaeon]